MMRNRILLALVVAACAGAPQSGFAADFIMPMATPIAPAAYDWSGAYVGGQLGYGMSNFTADPISLFSDAGITLAGTLPGFGFSGNGIIGGGEAGFNWQTGHLLFGLEGDISASGVRGTYTDTATNFSLDSSINWLSTARVRIGLPINRLLLFASAGVAIAGVTANLHDNYSGPPTTIDTSSSNTSVGWTVGGGVAAAITNRWSIKAEYLYADLGSKSYTFAETPSPPGWPLISTSGRTTLSLVRVGLDYKF